MKKLIATGLAAGAIAMVGGVATAGQAFADTTPTPSQATTQNAAQDQGGNQVRLFYIGALAEGLNTSSQLVELDGPVNKVFNGGHTPVGAKGPDVFQFSTTTNGLPGIVHAKWNFLDANNQVTDSVSMDMVVLRLPNQPAKLDLKNIRMGNTVQTSGIQFDSSGNLADDFKQNA
jgi:hypothetical protein